MTNKTSDGCIVLVLFASLVFFVAAICIGCGGSGTTTSAPSTSTTGSTPYNQLEGAWEGSGTPAYLNIVSLQITGTGYVTGLNEQTKDTYTQIDTGQITGSQITLTTPQGVFTGQIVSPDDQHFTASGKIGSQAASFTMQRSDN